MASDDPYWGTPQVDGLGDMPSSVRRSTEPGSSNNSRSLDNVIPDLKLLELFTHHLRDWLVILFCIIADAVLNVIHPFNRYVGSFYIDQWNRFPLKKNTVPTWAVPIIAILIPLAVFGGYFVSRRNTRDFHQAVLGLLTAVGVTAVFTDALKDGIGWPRPDFFWRCFPDGNESFDQFQQVICSGDAATIREGYKSFPSGHTSWSFAGLGYLSLYLAGKVTLFDRRGYTSRILIVFFPLLVAAMVAVSRVSDYWHHPHDVIAGAFLGLTIAYMSYKQHFPDFRDKMAAYPYPHIQGSNGTLLLAPRGNQVAWGEGSQAPPRANGGTYDLETV